MRNRFKWSLFMLVAFLFLLGACSNHTSMIENPKVKEGMLNLTTLGGKEMVRLDGDWEFYWNQLLNPQDIKNHTVQKTGYINIPSSWNQYKFEGKDLSGDGVATYRMIFTTEGSRNLALKLPRIFTSYKLWINNELVASAGTVGEDQKSMTPQYLPQVAVFQSVDGSNEIVIQVANYYHRSGGILESILLGEQEQILENRYKAIAFELFLFGSLTIIGAYHLILFLFRRKDKAPLYFGLFCLLPV